MECYVFIAFTISGKHTLNASFSRSGRITVVKCAGKYTVEACFPCAGKLVMNSIFYLCYPMVNTEFSTRFQKQDERGIFLSFTLW